jgi:hypothetical protein
MVGNDKGNLRLKKLPVWGVFVSTLTFRSAPAQIYNEQLESRMMFFGLTKAL